MATSFGRTGLIAALFLIAAAAVHGYSSANVGEVVTPGPVASLPPNCIHTGTLPGSEQGVPTLNPPPPFGMIVFSGMSIGQFGVEVQGPASAEVTLHPEHLALQLTNSRGELIHGNRFAFDPCIPFPQPFWKPPLPSYFIGFTFDWRGLPADLYRISAVPDPGFVTSEGKPVSVDPRFSSESTTVYIPEESPRPTLAIGQQFVVLPKGPNFSNPSMDKEDLNLLGRILTLEKISNSQLQLRIDGSAPIVYYPQPTIVTGAPGLCPLVDDPTVLRLRDKYLNKAVWQYGGGVTTHVPQPWPFDNTDLTISGIFRAYGCMTILHTGSVDAGGLDLAHDFADYDPIVVRFRPPANHVGATPIPTWALIPPDASIYFLVADSWDFERTYSLVPMQVAHPEWSQSTITDVTNRTVRMGMTKDMIAWMFGYPNAYGTRGQVNKLDAWHYDAPTPFQFSLFFHNGVVVKYDPPGRLP